MLHFYVLGYVAVALASRIVWVRPRPGQKFTKWQVLQVARLFAFALSAFSGQAEIVVR